MPLDGERGSFLGEKGVVHDPSPRAEVPWAAPGHGSSCFQLVSVPIHSFPGCLGY